jgi:hypothetical protein
VQAALLPLLDAWAYQTFNAGAVRAAAARGENFIQLVAQIDNKTTNFCRLVNGRVIPMARALAQLQRISDAVAAGDVNALIAAAPFHPNPSQATLEEVNAILDAGGLARSTTAAARETCRFGCRSRAKEPAADLP